MGQQGHVPDRRQRMTAPSSVEVAIQFREFAGTYMEHCHNTQHEDHSMLLRWDVEHPGQIKLMPAPMPTWDGVEFVDSAALPTFRTGDGVGPAVQASIPSGNRSRGAVKTAPFFV